MKYAVSPTIPYENASHTGVRILPISHSQQDVRPATLNWEEFEKVW